MILDANLAFSYTTSASGTNSAANTDNLAQVAGTYFSNNTIDLHIVGLPVLASGQGARDIGIGDDPALKLLVMVMTTFTSGGAPTLSVALQGAQDNGSGAPGAFTSWWASPAYALATLVAGARLLDMDMPRPPAGVAVPRFLRLAYTIGAATTTAGTATGFIVIDRHDEMYQGTNNAILGGYPPGVVITN